MTNSQPHKRQPPVKKNWRKAEGKIQETRPEIKRWKTKRNRMSMRNPKIQAAHLNRMRARIRHPQPIPETYLGPEKLRSMVALEKGTIPVSVFLVARRPPLSEHPLLWRWLARLVYQRINWAPDFGIEYQGVYTDAAEARHAASEAGGFLIEVPLNACLPPETCQYGAHDFPLSEVSYQYRNRKFQFVAVPRGQIERLQEKIRATDPIVEGIRSKAV